MNREAQSRLAAIAARPSSAIEVAEAALWIASEEYPDLDVALYVRRLDQLATRARERVARRAGAAEAIARLNHFLFVECGFAGNQEDYYDPRNSFLNEVLERRRGIPISLAIVYTEVGRRLDLPVVGVGFPGHFLVKHAEEPEILVDPFFGTVVTRADCARRLEESFGTGGDLDPELFRLATAREVLVRMLRNLKQIYLARNDLRRALDCASRILLFLPSEARELRDRGILYLRLECFTAALGDFERSLELAPEGESAAELRAALSELRRRVERLQ